MATEVAPAQLTLKVAAVGSLREALHSGVRVRVSASKPASAEIRIRSVRARRGSRRARAGSVLGSRTVALNVGANLARVRLKASARRRLRHLHRVRLLVELRSAGVAVSMVPALLR
jgi:hypothetical protein